MTEPFEPITYRHLADTWANTYIQPGDKRRLRPSATELSTIEHLILLDLLGAPRPRIQSFFIDTAWLFDAMVSAERRLASAGAFGANVDEGNYVSFFVPRTGSEKNMGYIGDDHVPFLQRGVSVLHVIANPFPSVWHKLSVSGTSDLENPFTDIVLQDDASALDLDTMKRWSMIMRVFMSEYLALEPAGTATTVKRSPADLVCIGVHKFLRNLIEPDHAQ